MVPIHAELTADGQEIVLLAVGPDHAVAGAAKMLQNLTPLFTKSDPPGALVVPATWAAVVQLAATFSPGYFGGGWYPGPRLEAWINERTAERLTAAAPGCTITYTPPAGLRPYPWQVEGAALIAATGNALITDEPGTGKTITTILGLVERWARAGEAEPWLTGPALVICPASVVDPWVTAWQTWAPHVRAVAYRGPKRKALLGTADVYITSYETARVDAPAVNAKGLAPLRELGVQAVVIDECHMVKNHQTARSQAVRRLSKHASAVIALSGTPITHHPGDLWPTLAAIEPHAWPSRGRWVSRYCLTLPGDYDEEVLGLLPATEPEFRLTMLGQMRRVAKADVLAELPPKVYSTRTVELPKEWRKAYDAMEEQMLAELPDGEELSVMSTLAKMTRLNQLASAPATVAVSYETDAEGIEREHVTVTLRGPSWKVDALLEVMAERPGQPIVAFAPSKQLIKLAGAAASAEGYRVGYLTGDVTGPARAAVVEAFQRGGLDLICVTTGAGGVGITLTAASTCVFLQRPWAFVEASQAEDRLHRIGAEGHASIEVIDIVAKGTIDSRVRAVLRERGQALADLLQDPRIASEVLGGTASAEERAA
jgi:SNF2 family DNA or RNA helicase